MGNAYRIERIFRTKDYTRAFYLRYRSLNRNFLKLKNNCWIVDLRLVLMD